MAEPDYAPTPAMIRAACERIQMSWDRPTERSRRTGSAEFKPYELPSMRAVDAGRRSAWDARRGRVTVCRELPAHVADLFKVDRGEGTGLGFGGGENLTTIVVIQHIHDTCRAYLEVRIGFRELPRLPTKRLEGLVRLGLVRSTIGWRRNGCSRGKRRTLCPIVHRVIPAKPATASERISSWAGDDSDALSPGRYLEPSKALASRSWGCQGLGI